MKGYSMISTGFSALDNCIGGLKKGKRIAEFEVLLHMQANVLSDEK